jgi:Ca2+-binding EF-hand superfamily protein
VGGLQVGTTYYFRAVAKSATGPVQYGEILHFTAAGIDPNAGPEEFLFTALDGSWDDRLTPAEWLPIYVTAPRRETAFAALDANGDGFLSFAEFSAAATNRASLRTFDTALQRTKAFLSIDTNEDNAISRTEIAFMWAPGTVPATIDRYWSRAGVGADFDFWEWLHASTLPNFTTYSRATQQRAERQSIAAQLDQDHDESISFAEFSHLYRPGSKTSTIDSAWRAANATPRGTASPVSMSVTAFVEAPRLPRLVVY